MLPPIRNQVVNEILTYINPIYIHPIPWVAPWLGRQKSGDEGVQQQAQARVP